MAKKISHVSISKMVNEELTKYLHEDMFAGIKDIDDMKAWIVRQWFGPKSKDKPWFDPSVDADNVLLKVVKNPKFPYSPNQLKDMWKNMPAIKRGLSAATADADLDAVAANVDGGGVYKTGEKTLSKIGKELGDVSATMIKKLGDQGEEKIRSFYGVRSPYDLSQEDEDDLFARIDSARKEAANEFAVLLKASKGNIKNFLAALAKAQILGPNETDMVSPDEIQGLTLLATKDKDIVVDTLLDDIDDFDNVFKTFQNAVSKKVFPPKKRGRPKKNP